LRYLWTVTDLLTRRSGTDYADLRIMPTTAWNAASLGEIAAMGAA
jgi:hypothetical protein